MFQGEEQTHSQESMERSQVEFPQHPKGETQRKRERTGELIIHFGHVKTNYDQTIKDCKCIFTLFSVYRNQVTPSKA